MSEKKCDKDLPLMANTNDILVCHYIFNLFCSFENRQFSGTLIMQLNLVNLNRNAMENTAQGTGLSNDHSYHANPDDATVSEGADVDTVSKFKGNENSEYVFVCILDCNDIIVEKVEEMHIPSENFDNSKFQNCKFELYERTELNFCVEEWCLKIWKLGVFCSDFFPTCVIITYKTNAQGESLLWVPDQDNSPAVYTYGAWINNRSLFPCQEPPVAMASWEATISVEDPAVVLMSGDERATVTSYNSISSYYYYTKMKLPMSTLALAVGFWNVEGSFRCKPDNLHVDVRIWASPSILEKAVMEFGAYIFSCIKAAESFLDAYPFPRIDFLIVPRGFASLGMASPNIIFLSQSLLAGNGSMCCRIAHEISHAWFGLLIGASDWTEEWLSEGFATFLEDVIHAKAMSLSKSEELDYREVKAFMRAGTLIAEMQNTEEELHILRPNKGEVSVQEIDGVEAVILKNGRNPEKGFMQVHYIKGFFLLKYLSDAVGEPLFLQFLKSYVKKYQGQLVDSMEMLALYTVTFPEICGENITVEKIASEWLHSSRIPKAITGTKPSVSNHIYQSATNEAEKWKKLNSRCLTRKTRKRRKFDLEQFSMLSPDVLSLLLDALLHKENVSHSIMKLLCEVYSIEEENADVRHKWCELVVKHRYYRGYNCLQNFLCNDLAMGVYLYGELILNGTTQQKDLAIHCFSAVRKEMEPNCYTTVQDMLNQVVQD